jgi:hypothetical protein
MSNRRAIVRQSGQAIQVQYAGLLAGSAPISALGGGLIAPPVHGGNMTGAHYFPVPGVDEVIVLEEQDGWKTTSVSAMSTPTKTNPTPGPDGNPGEYKILAPDHTDAVYVQTAALTLSKQLVLVNQAASAPVTLTGTCSASGTDPQGGTVSVTGTCAVTFPHSWPVTIDGIPFLLVSPT